MLSRKKILVLISYIVLLGFAYASRHHHKAILQQVSTGFPIDSLNGVTVYYNGSIGNVSGRNVTKDGYNLGLKYQCVEFVKRYYYEHLNHKMPNSYGHAKDFFNSSIADGKTNPDRGLFQYTNGSSTKPKVNDLVIFDGNSFNKYGHVAIISKVNTSSIEIIQQNVGMSSRANIDLKNKGGKWRLGRSDILGWLRKK